MGLTDIQVIQQISARFPWWGNCHFQLERAPKTLIIEADDSRKRHRILQELRQFDAVSLGFETVILKQPGYAEKIFCNFTHQVAAFSRLSQIS